jgi:stress response protein SCP2
MKLIPLSLMGMLTLSAAAGAQSPSNRSVSLTQEPLVMRLNKDEFRIAFGINGEHCGAIRYRVDWKTADGKTRSEVKRVNYTVSPSATRTIAVDRQYFHNAEGQQTTDVVKVSVDAITCLDGAGERAGEFVRL